MSVLCQRLTSLTEWWPAYWGDGWDGWSTLSVKAAAVMRGPL
jgi:hypothetical protein